jgi:hypothetical protein
LWGDVVRSYELHLSDKEKELINSDIVSMSNIGQLLNLEIIKSRLMVKDFALKFGVKPSYLSQVLANKRPPTAAMLEFLGFEKAYVRVKK